MIEAAMVFDVDGGVIQWHTPGGCTASHIPDSANLWDILWEHRGTLGGVAHTHIGGIHIAPSHTDATTFAAIEAGLGKRLLWPIAGETKTNFFSWNGRFHRYEVDYDAFWEYSRKPRWRTNLELLLQKSRYHQRL